MLNEITTKIQAKRHYVFSTPVLHKWAGRQQ